MFHRFQHIFPLLTIALVTLVSFLGLTNTFFQQDEWQYFGSTIFSLSSSHPLANVALPFQGQITHFFPLATIFFLFEYIVFKVNFPPYAMVNLIIHIVNASLVYWLILLLTQKRIIAWGSSILFSVNSISHQPITWIAAGIGTLPGMLFLLLFLLSLVRFVQTKRSVILVLSCLTLLLSILFKETSLFIFLLLPLMWFAIKILYHHSLKIPNAARISFAFLGAIYIALRVFFLITPIRSAQPEIGDVSLTSPVAYAYRFVTLPLKAFPQSIIPFSTLRIFSTNFARFSYPQFIESDGIPNPYVVESILFDLTCYFVSLFLLLLSFICYRRLQKREPGLAKLLIISLLFIATSALPFMFVPGLAGFFSIFEPRNMYITSVGSSVWIVLVLYSFRNWPRFIRKRTLFVMFFIALIVMFHGFSIQRDIRMLVKIGNTRKHFLTTFELNHTKLPQKVVFFTESDKSYYGLPVEEKILPLQSGFGRMLMVWYQDKEKFPGCLYGNQFLHGLLDEGYMFCDGRGFGYARQYKTLLKLLREHKLSPEVVIAYSWSDPTKRFFNITSEIQAKLSADLQSL